MLVSRTYKHNIGYQVDVDRPHPIWAWPINRYNKNNYTFDGYNIRMNYEPGSKKGLQYGGKLKKTQSGEGVDVESIAKAAQLLQQMGKQALNFYSSETGTKLKNQYGKFMNNNPNWRPGFAGEKHMINKYGITYNWLGPGTNVRERLARGDPPLDGPDGLDMAAKIHDIEYSNARSWKDVRKADNKFIKNVEASNANRASKAVIKGLFKAKKIAEDIGLAKPQDFTELPNLGNQIPSKIQEEQPPTNISGQGYIFKNRDPARKLKNKIRKYRNKKKS